MAFLASTAAIHRWAHAAAAAAHKPGMRAANRSCGSAKVWQGEMLATRKTS